MHEVQIIFYIIVAHADEPIARLYTNLLDATVRKLLRNTWHDTTKTQE
jgi:hypothetical protein